MAAPIDVGVSLAVSSAAQAGDIKTGDFTVGGSGGTNAIPPYVWVGLAVLGAIFLFSFLFRGRRNNRRA